MARLAREAAETFAGYFGQMRQLTQAGSTRREQFNHVPVRIADEKLRSAVRTTLARQVFYFE